MGSVPHLITLNTDDGSESAWKSLFKDSNDKFSTWVREKIIEEHQKRLDPKYIYNKLANLETEKAFWESQLIKSKQNIVAQEQRKQVIEKEIDLKNDPGRQFNKLVREIGSLLESPFICKPLPSREVWENLAREYLVMPTETRGDLIQFLLSKGYKKKEAKAREIPQI